MNENMEKSLFRNAPAVILGSGLITPLSSNQSLSTHMVLGGSALVSILFMFLIIAFFGKRIPYNSRTLFAVLLTGGIVSILSIVITPVFKGTHPPVDTLAPFLLVIALLGLYTEAYAVKKWIQPVLYDTFCIGANYFMLLCLCGILRDFAGNHFAGKSEIIPGMAPVTYFSTPSGTFLIVALMVAVITLISRNKKRTNP